MLPSRILYYTNIVKGESSSKTGKQRFTGIDVAEPHPIFYKYTKKTCPEHVIPGMFLFFHVSAIVLTWHIAVQLVPLSLRRQ